MEPDRMRPPLTMRRAERNDVAAIVRLLADDDLGARREPAASLPSASGQSR